MKPLSGPALAQHLAPNYPYRVMGVLHNDGTYVLDFFHYGMNAPVPSARQLAPEITRYLGTATITSTHDTIADWRPEQPVINAQVSLRLTAFAVGAVVSIGVEGKIIQRKSVIHEIKISPYSHTAFYRVSIAAGMDHYWISEARLLELNPRESKSEKVIPPSHALLVLDAA